MFEPKRARCICRFHNTFISPKKGIKNVCLPLMKARTFVSDLHLVVPFKVVQSDINIYSDLTASTKSCLPFIETAIVTSLYQTRVVSGFKANFKQIDSHLIHQSYTPNSCSIGLKHL